MENMKKDVKFEPKNKFGLYAGNSKEEAVLINEFAKKEEAEKAMKNHLERLKEINIGGYAEVKEVK